MKQYAGATMYPFGNVMLSIRSFCSKNDPLFLGLNGPAVPKKVNHLMLREVKI